LIFLMITDEVKNRSPHILLAVTGSVATIKIYELVKELTKLGQVKVMTTASALHFFDPKAVEGALVYTDKDEYTLWQGRNDPVLHVELREWADLLLFAPLSANTMAKLANGLCDNLVTSVARAWNYKDKPVLAAPAMNTTMWENIFTEKHLSVLRSDWLNYDIIDPRHSKLICNTTGIGAMATVETIIERTKKRL